MPDDLPVIPRRRGKKNKPIDNAWRQQRLSSLRPQITVDRVFPYAIILGLVLLGFGLGIYFTVDRSLEQEIEYTNCRTQNGSDASMISNFSYGDGAVKCVYQFTLPEDYKGNVKFFYGLRGFYQNFRLYLSSRNDLQLAGDLTNVDDCDPLDCSEYEDEKNKTCSIPIVPCGFIANSMFNDSFKLYYHDRVNTSVVWRVPFSTNGIITDLERKRKFKNPTFDASNNETLCDAFNNTGKPPWWQKSICELGKPTDGDEETEFAGVGLENVDFMVWMKPAALPYFRKPYRVLYRQSDLFSDGLKEGNYTLVINYNYPVGAVGGRKYFYITRETWMGPRNFFLPIVFMICGVFIILAFTGLCLCFALRRKFSP